jgi:hypothetical protein
MDLCKYKDIFGAPGEGVHSIRVFNIAVVDLFLTIIAAIIISYLLNMSFLIIFIDLIVLGIILHKLFCVDTTLNKLIFGKNIRSNY